MRIDWLSKLQLTLQASGVAQLRPLSDLVVADPNTVLFFTHVQVLGRNGNGKELEMGFPSIIWRWDWLPQTDIDILQGYERNLVYVRTETLTGTLRAHVIYQAYMQRLRLGPPRPAAWDHNPSDGFRQKRPVEIEFSQAIRPELIEPITDSFVDSF